MKDVSHVTKVEAMSLEHVIDLDDLFVGRTEELALLNALWEKTLKPREHNVYVLLNAPGIGKTRLLEQFGVSLESRQIGLYFHYQCDSRFQTIKSLSRDLLEKLSQLLDTKESYIRRYIIEMEPPPRHDKKLSEFNRLLEQLEHFLLEGTESLDAVVSILDKLATFIPVFFVADEIQEFQKITLSVTLPISNLDEVSGKENLESGLHYFTRLLKALTRSRILMALSGTQYQILSQISTKIGSPIAQKVHPILIKTFTKDEIDEYVEQVRIRVMSTLPSEKMAFLEFLINHYRRFLYSFSGGHPRTVALITRWFLANLPSLLSENPDNERFVDLLFSQVETDFKQRILTLEKQDHVRQLQVQEWFPMVKDWMLKNATTGLALGSEPQVPVEARKHVEDILYQLMTIGIIVKNGLNRYHVTSYFHLLAFLECFTDQHEQFLRQVLTNKFFKLLCGSHAGFGYTFEHVVISALILNTREISTAPQKGTDNKIREHHDHPFSFRDMTAVEEISGDVDWTKFNVKPKILYHAPTATVIDFVYRENENRLVLIQVTTSVKPRMQKLHSLAKLVEDVQKLKTDMTVIGWFVSLFPLSEQEPEESSNQQIIISAGQDLKFLLGESLLERLMTIKKELS